MSCGIVACRTGENRERREMMVAAPPTELTRTGAIN
jgi:hypothetical protein